MSGTAGARFWAVDLHTHTPASGDVKPKTYGAMTAEEIVQAALDANLDAIAITDHNTSTWCDQVGKAAKDTGLIVLPGVEISTTEGHLLAIWAEGTPGASIDEVLVSLGIKKPDQGKLDIAATVGFAEAAREVAKADGIAIAAHVDRPRGLLQLPVAAHLKRTLLEPGLCAVEIVDLATRSTVAQKVGKDRTLACIRGSDVTLPGKNIHTVKGIGSRRTWIKATRADLVGIKHALNDPDLRIRLEDPSILAPHPCIESVTLSGGFLEETVQLSPDLNCLLGGTGAGKSLVLESLRYVLGQQVDSKAFPRIWAEVDARLQFGLGHAGVVRVVASVDGNRYAIERPYADDGNAIATVRQETGDEWTDIEDLPEKIIPLAAFSQGEVLEFSRQPVGRMSLLDSAIDFDDISERGEDVLVSLRTNAGELLAQRLHVLNLETAVTKESEVTDRVNELSALFGKDVVKQQEGWKKESSRLTRAQQSLPKIVEADFAISKAAPLAEIPTNKDLFDQIEVARTTLQDSVSTGLESIRTAIQNASTEIGSVKTTWDSRFEKFKGKLDKELEKVKDGASLVILRGQLEQLQEQQLDIQTKKTDLEQVEAPRLKELVDERDGLLEELQKIRDKRRRLRRARATQLNAKTAKIVKLDVSAYPDKSAFRSALDKLKTGSHVKDEVLEAIVTHIHPFRFARCLLDSDLQALTDAKSGIDINSVARLYANVDDKNLWAELLDAQICDMPDRLDMKFRKPEDGTYAAIEQLAHGQRCTAILVVLLADGVDPVIVDQPEDALHAPWIEDYLVDRLRALRGERQYIFATRSPGIVVGGDAEQIITMKATSGKGEIEATGSLERHDLNKLALHHLEGGPVAFKRRSGKLDVSVNSR